MLPMTACSQCKMTPYRSCRECVEALLSDRIQRLELAVWYVIDSFEAAVRSHDRRLSPGGQQVSYHGDFASGTPGTYAALSRYARDLRSALRGEWPKIRSEYAEAYPSTDAIDLDRMFGERQP